MNTELHFLEKSFEELKTKEKNYNRELIKLRAKIDELQYACEMLQTNITNAKEKLNEKKSHSN